MTIWCNSIRSKQRVTCTTRPPPPFKFSTHVKQTIFLDISDTAGPYSIFIFLLSQTKPITQPPFPLQIVKAGWREWKASNCFYDRVRDVNRAGRQSGGAEEGPYDSGVQLQTKDVGLPQKSWRTTPPTPLQSIGLLQWKRVTVQPAQQQKDYIIIFSSSSLTLPDLLC